MCCLGQRRCTIIFLFLLVHGRTPYDVQISGGMFVLVPKVYNECGDMDDGIGAVAGDINSIKVGMQG